MRYARRLRAKTRALVRRHRHKIEHIAKALIERRLISGRNVDKVLRQVTSIEERRNSRQVYKARRKQLREMLEVLRARPHHRRALRAFLAPGSYRGSGLTQPTHG